MRRASPVEECGLRGALDLVAHPTDATAPGGWAARGRLRRERRGNLIVARHAGGCTTGFTPSRKATRERGLEGRTLGGVSGPGATR